ncbi:MAG: histidine phosphatase family protein [Acidimicrobiia bacterium]|nr:histidine phosphatase family protein [Acidimicrobiia bacterium]
MPRSCDVFVLRHGESSANSAGELVGRRDPPLTERGRSQVVEAAAYLRSLEKGALRVVSSPLSRARETAAALGTPFVCDDRLVELDYGDLEGRSFGDLLASWPPAWITDPEVVVPGGESVAAMASRVFEAVGEHGAAADAAGAALVVVTHLGPTKALVGLATGDLAGAQSRVHVSQASITRLRLHLDGPGLSATLVALNLVEPG